MSYLSDRIKPEGFILIRKYDEDGNLVLDEFIANVVCTIGKQRCASHLANSNPGKTWFTHLALGTNTDAASSEDLALGAEFKRFVFDSVFAAAATVFGHVTFSGNDIGAGQTWTIAEMGLVDAAVGGNLICRQVLGTSESLAGTQTMDVLWGVMT